MSGKEETNPAGGVQCRGSVVLETGCMRCGRCVEESMRLRDSAAELAGARAMHIARLRRQRDGARAEAEGLRDVRRLGMEPVIAQQMAIIADYQVEAAQLDRGRRAATHGAAREDNPHKPGSQFREAWDVGWRSESWSRALKARGQSATCAPMSAAQALALVDRRLMEWAATLSCGGKPGEGVAADTLRTFALTMLPTIRTLAQALDGLPLTEQADTDGGDLGCGLGYALHKAEDAGP